MFTVQNTLEFIVREYNIPLDTLNRRYENRSLDALLHWSLDTFGEGIVQVTSFGPTGMVLLDHLAQIRPGMKIITLDTDFLFEETYTLIEEVQRRYPVDIEIHKSKITPQTQAAVHGSALWKRDPNRCCYIRKVVPLTQALEGYSAWFAGLRRDQSATRADLPLIAWDDDYDMVKVNPLAKWTRGQIWKYIVENNVPYNKLHDKGYASIGCTHCTAATSNPADERSGRWIGFNKTECGIHI